MPGFEETGSFPAALPGAIRLPAVLLRHHQGIRDSKDFCYMRPSVFEKGNPRQARVLPAKALEYRRRAFNRCAHFLP